MLRVHIWAQYSVQHNYIHLKENLTLSLSNNKGNVKNCFGKGTTNSLIRITILILQKRFHTKVNLWHYFDIELHDQTSDGE